MPGVHTPHPPGSPGDGATDGGLSALGRWLADDGTVGRLIVGKPPGLSALCWWQVAALARDCGRLALTPAGTLPDRAGVCGAVRDALDLAVALGTPPGPPGPRTTDYRDGLGEVARTLAALLADPAATDPARVAAATDRALYVLVVPARLLLPPRPAPCTRPLLRRRQVRR